MLLLDHQLLQANKACTTVYHHMDTTSVLQTQTLADAKYTTEHLSACLGVFPVCFNERAAMTGLDIMIKQLKCFSQLKMSAIPAPSYATLSCSIFKNNAVLFFLLALPCFFLFKQGFNTIAFALRFGDTGTVETSRPSKKHLALVTCARPFCLSWQQSMCHCNSKSF
jgi:hypothetical protein